MSLKESRKQAAIATLGALGSGLGQPRSFRHSSISPKDISAKPPPAKRLGQRENNRFLAQTELLKGPLSANVNKSASFDDVTPYIPSSYIKTQGYRTPAYTEQPYTTRSGDVSTTKQADLNGLASMLQSYVPKDMAEASNKIMDASKNLYSTIAKGFKPPEGQDNIFSNIGKQVSSVATGVSAKVTTGIDKLREMIKSKSEATSAIAAPTIAPTPTPTPATNPVPAFLNSAQAGEANKSLIDSINNAATRARSQDFVRQTTPQAPAALPEVMGPPSSLATKQPAPATVSRASMLGQPASPPSLYSTFKDFDQKKNERAPAAPFDFSSIGTKLDPSLISGPKQAPSTPWVGDPAAEHINDQYKKFLASGGQPTTPQNAIPVGAASNTNAIRAVNSGLSSDMAGRFDLAPAIMKHINKYRTSDLTDLPADTRASFERLSESEKGGIINQLVINAKYNGALSDVPEYKPASGFASIDSGINSAVDVLYNQFTNLPKSLLSIVPGVDPESQIPGGPPTSNTSPFLPTQLIQNTGNTSAAIDTAVRVKLLNEAIGTADAQMRRDLAQGLDTSESERKIYSLMDLRNNEQATDAYTNDWRKPTLLPLFDPEKGVGAKSFETLGDAFSTLLPPLTAFRAFTRFGTNAAGVPNADAWGDVAGLGLPQVARSIPQIGKLIATSPAAVSNAVRNPKQIINAVKNVNLYNAIKAAPSKALNVITSNPALIGSSVAEIINNKERQLPSTDPKDYPTPPPRAPAESNTPAAESNIPAAANHPSLTSLQQLLIAGGISVPAAIALVRTMGPKGSDELPDDELSEDEEEE